MSDTLSWAGWRISDEGNGGQRKLEANQRGGAGVRQASLAPVGSALDKGEPGGQLSLSGGEGVRPCFSAPAAGTSARRYGLLPIPTGVGGVQGLHGLSLGHGARGTQPLFRNARRPGICWVSPFIIPRPNAISRRSPSSNCPCPWLCTWPGNSCVSLRTTHTWSFR